MHKFLVPALAVFVMLLQGCADAAKSQPLPDLRAFIATSGMISIMSPSPAPLPPQPPAPAPARKECENCRGTGIVGDGRTGITCSVCGGKGFVEGAAALPSGFMEPAKASPPVSPAGERAAARSPARSAAPGFDQPTFRIVCEDGVCRRIQIAPPQR